MRTIDIIRGMLASMPQCRGCGAPATCEGIGHDRTCDICAIHGAPDLPNAPAIRAAVRLVAEHEKRTPAAAFRSYPWERVASGLGMRARRDEHGHVHLYPPGPGRAHYVVADNGGEVNVSRESSALLASLPLTTTDGTIGQWTMVYRIQQVIDELPIEWAWDADAAVNADATADTETTGVRPGVDRAVQVGIVRFERGAPVGSFGSLVNPGIAIPEEATAIHGITDADVADAPSIADIFARPEVLALFEGAQPAAYNAPFDRHFVPPFGDDWTWPWLDTLSIVRVVDKYVKGEKRHTLSVTCARHGIVLLDAHSALADAGAAGTLFYKLGATKIAKGRTLGELLRRQRIAEANNWFDFMSYRAKLAERAEDEAHAGYEEGAA